MKLYMLGKGVSKYYKTHVKGNQFADQNLIQKKLTRNVMLSKKYQLANNEKLYIYGNLLIFTKGNTIVRLNNIKGNGIIEYDVDKEKYNQLNKELKIPSPKQTKNVGIFDKVTPMFKQGDNAC
jgi:hypothetical protein